MDNKQPESRPVDGKPVFVSALTAGTTYGRKWVQSELHPHYPCIRKPKLPATGPKARP